MGKTSRVRYLIHGMPGAPDEPRTRGVPIEERIQTETWSPADPHGPLLNVWDFGGQEIMHGTHRFFLTRRSLYLLVLEDRREDDGSVYQRLRTIRNRAEDSPVIVGINQADEQWPRLQLPEQSLRSASRRRPRR